MLSLSKQVVGTCLGFRLRLESEQFEAKEIAQAGVQPVYVGGLESLPATTWFPEHYLE